MSDIIRVLRIIEYVGPREWVEHSLNDRWLKGCKKFYPAGGPGYIREGMLGETAEVLGDEPERAECPEPQVLCSTCGHERSSHIYNEGACRPGFVCGDACEKFT